MRISTRRSRGQSNCKPKHTVLTHMNHMVDYDVIKAKCPPGVEPAYDGLELEVPDVA